MPTGLSGSLRIDGSSTVGPLTTAVAEQFNGENPDVEIAVGESGTGGGFEKFCAGETVINDASRQIEAEEEALCKKGGVEYEEVVVANDALTVVAQHREPEHLPDGRSARGDLGPGHDGHELGRRRGRRQRVHRGDRALRAGYRLRHVRLLHRRGQR